MSAILGFPNRAFSAIELMAVVLIMGLLISLGCLAYQQTRLASYRQSTHATIQTIAAMLQQSHHLPQSLPNTLPQRDAWGQEIQYLPQDKTFALRSAGADGQFNNNDDIFYETESF